MKAKSWVVGLVLLVLSLATTTEADAHCHHWRWRHYGPRRVWIAPAPRVVITPAPMLRPWRYYRHPRWYAHHPRRWYRGPRYHHW